jgi:hypothetical protein
VMSTGRSSSLPLTNEATDGACVTIHATAWITKSPIPETSTADLRATIQLQIGGELRKT